MFLILTKMLSILYIAQDFLTEQTKTHYGEREKKNWHIYTQFCD